MSDAKIHIQYKVGGLPQQPMTDVNLGELLRLLRQFYNTDDWSYVNVVLGLEATNPPNAEEWVSVLARSPKLELKTNANPDFFSKWWESQTPAGSVVYLLQEAVREKKQQAKDAIYEQIRQNMEASVQSIIPHFAETVTTQDVDAWIARHR